MRAENLSDEKYAVTMMVLPETWIDQQVEIAFRDEELSTTSGSLSFANHVGICFVDQGKTLFVPWTMVAWVKR